MFCNPTDYGKSLPPNHKMSKNVPAKNALPKFLYAEYLDFLSFYGEDSSYYPQEFLTHPFLLPIGHERTVVNI